LLDEFLNKYEPSPSPSVPQFVDSFRLIAKTVPSFSVWSGKRCPIVFIDEANKLQKLGDKGGKNEEALQELLEWMVRITKQEEQMHIVLGSSDALFLFWLKTQISDRVEIIVIGDLAKQQANEFFATFKLDNLNFEKDVYPVCGGRMYDIYSAASIFTRDNIRPENNNRTQDAFHLVNAAMHVKKGEVIASKYAKAAVKFSRLDYKRIAKRVIADGFCDYQEVCNKFGTSAIHDMIRHNLFAYRPKQPLVQDIPNQPTVPVIVPISPVVGFAMRKVFKE